MSFLISGDCNIGLKNVYFKTTDGVWKRLTDNMRCTYTPDGISLICDEQNSCICEKECMCEEEKEMNKILQLYTERKEKEIHDKYDKLVEEEYNKIEFVEVYNNLVNAFEGALDELFEDEENIGGKYLQENGFNANAYKYRLMTNKIKNKIREKYNEYERKELAELHTLVNEVETMLSLADNGSGVTDNIKVQSLLIKYEIIDENLRINA